jgi:hypothetical protein
MYNYLHIFAVMVPIGLVFSIDDLTEELAIKKWLEQIKG